MGAGNVVAKVIRQKGDRLVPLVIVQHILQDSVYHVSKQVAKNARKQNFQLAVLRSRFIVY